MDEGRRLSQSLLHQSRSSLSFVGEEGGPREVGEDRNETQRPTEVSPDEKEKEEDDDSEDIPDFKLPELDLEALLAEEAAAEAGAGGAGGEESFL